MSVSNVGMVILYALLPVFDPCLMSVSFQKRSISPLSVHIGDQTCAKTIPSKSSVLITFGEDYYILSVQVLYKQIWEPTRIIRGPCSDVNMVCTTSLITQFFHIILCSILIRESKTPISRCKNQWLVGSLFLVVSFTTSIFHGLTMVVDTDDIDFLKISTSWK